MLRVSRTSYYYEAKLKDDSAIIKQLSMLAEKHPRYGFMKMYLRLKNLGFSWNKKRIYRVYCDMKLNLRVKPKKRLPSRNPAPLVQPIASNIIWSMDFMSDTLINGKKFRTFNVIDDFNREALDIEIASSITGRKVAEVLDRICYWRGYPNIIRLDNGPEFISKYLADWAYTHGVQLSFIEPGSPAQNAYIERFNRSYREEILDMYLFRNLSEVKHLTDDWLVDYNSCRPHESLNGQTPYQFAKK